MSEQERLDEMGIRAVWFGFLPSYAFLTLLLIFSITAFIGYVVIVDFPPLIPLVILVVTGFGGAYCIAVRSTTTRVALAIERNDSDDTDTGIEYIDVLPTIVGVPTFLVGIMVLAFVLVYLAVLSVQTGNVAFTVLSIGGIIAITLGMVAGTQAALEIIDENDGRIPNGVSSYLWTVRTKTMNPLA